MVLQRFPFNFNSMLTKIPMILCHGRFWKAVQVWPKCFAWKFVPWIGLLCVSQSPPLHWKQKLSAGWHLLKTLLGANGLCSLTRCGSHPQTHVLTSSLNTAASWFPQIALHAVLRYSLMSSSTRVISSFFSHLSWKISRRDSALHRDQNAVLQPISVHHLSSF